MSDRNGVTDGTKMSASERVGNIFILLCAMHSADGEMFLLMDVMKRMCHSRK